MCVLNNVLHDIEVKFLVEAGNLENLACNLCIIGFPVSSFYRKFYINVVKIIVKCAKFHVSSTKFPLNWVKNLPNNHFLKIQIQTVRLNFILRLLAKNDEKSYGLY